MGRVYMTGGGGSGLDPDELTASASDVLSGKKAGVQGSDEPVNGTMPNRGAVSRTLNAGGSYTISAGYHNGGGKVTANSLASQTNATATEAKILSGYTAWVNGNKLTGTVTVNSILSFSAAAYSTNQILLQWQNPYAASGKPFSGVFINYSTSGYPGQSGGIRIYTGYGSNANPGGISQVIVTMPAVGTTYYFSATPYSSATPSDLWGTSLNAVAATTTRGQQAITESGVFTVPSGVRSIDIFVVGGGSTGAMGQNNSSIGGRGGNSGRTAWVLGYAVNPGQQFVVTVGAGGRRNKSSPYPGGATNFGGIVNADGGTKPSISAGNGGSGGGVNMSFNHSKSTEDYYDTAGGSDGGDGVTSWTNGGSPVYGGVGQHYTTRAFGESWNTIYAGGGGGGGNYSAGGAGGGGTGGGFRAMPTDGVANTGGGGGGGGRDTEYISRYCGGGGSGICIVRWGY